ncbi:serine protease [Pilimelia anulata]|uniref:Serine protease n=1 Tax=Pilimelia anulata TaxID=53371 RepID=A0A8J3FBL0_9ACTN|nr:S1 family peptidase [Pilimelia anulata]GGJ96705.1 serine protease [Pilimelia anulata]
MNRILWTLCAPLAITALLPATGVAAAHRAADPTPSTRIVGGKELTSLEQNPGATGLHVKTDIPGNGGFICGSMRIGPTWVLTAKHCIMDKYTYTQVSTNTIKRSEGPRPNIVRVIKHPKKIDLALVEIDDANAPGKILPYSDKGPAIGSSVLNYGWGRVDPDNPSPVLKVAEGTVARYSQSPVTSPIDLTEGVDLIFKPVDGLCWLGDSGGPLLDRTGAVVGVTSWSNGNGTMNGICAHLSLAHQGTAKWIADTTGIKPGTRF